MTGILWYKDDIYLNDGSWNQFAISELVDVTYVDEVYKPAVFTCTIQNISGGGGLAQSSVAHNGGGSVDGDIIVTKSGHSLSTTDRIFISSETTGDIEPRIYEVEKIDNNTFYIRHFAINPWSGRQQTGSSVNRITGQYTGSTGGTLTYVPTGKYSIASPSVANPDLKMGQEIIYWHMPEEFSLVGPYTHTGADTDGLVVAHTAHGYPDGTILQVVNESTSAVQDGEYQVWARATDSYKLRNLKSLELINGNGGAGTIHLYLDNNSKAFPLFYGTITSLEGTWSPAYGKVIKIQAKDHLQYFNNTTVKKIQKTFRSVGEKIGSGDTKQGGQPHMGTSLKSPIYLDGKKTIPNPVITVPPGARPVIENKVSHAIANVVSDFNEGAGLIYTDNANGSGTGMLCEKFEASGFQMTDNELKSGQFKRDLTDVGHKVLRAMQDMAMSDRHVTSNIAVTGATWSITGSGTNPFIISASGLVVGQTIGIKNSSLHSSGVAIPNGYYVVGTGNKLLTIDGDGLSQVASNGTCDVAGVEDGNFGYDFYLDSGIYGVPNEYGYTQNALGVDGSTDIKDSFAPKPHLNYFKRGYKPFRPDATGLNIVSPSEDDVEETGQIRIMMKNTSWTLGDDEIISDVELQITDTEEGNTDKSELGHNLALMRIKKIQCCNNVDGFTSHTQRLNHAGRWNGEFHWNRHDSFDNKVITGESVGGAPPEKHETLVGINDQAMFCQSGSTLTNPGFEDDATYWLPSEAGTGAGLVGDFWGAHAYLDVGDPASLIVRGTVQDREIVRRVIFNEMGGIGFAGGSETVVSADNIYGGGAKVSGYAGPSQVPMIGRSLTKGPGVVAMVTQFPTGYHYDPTWGEGPDEEELADNPPYTHRYPLFNTGVVDCDLIKSIKNCQEEGLMTTTTYSPTSIKDDDGDLLVNDNDRHNFQTGAMIVITSGTALDTDDYWNNYKRVEIPLPPTWWKPLDGFDWGGDDDYNGIGTLLNSIAADDTSVTLEAGQGARFPGAEFLITVTGSSPSGGAETMRCTSRTSDVLTVVRGELITTTVGGAPVYHQGSFDVGYGPLTGDVVQLDATSFNVLADGRLGGRQFYLTDLPHEAYEGIVGTIPAALPMSSSNRMQYSEGTITGYKRVYNVFDGVCRIQYQSTTTRNELPNTDSYVLISDRTKMDVPYMGVEVYAIADEDRTSSTASISGLTTGAATMPDSVMYGETGTTGTPPNAVTGFVGGVGRYIDEQIRSNAMPVRFRTGDKLSETRFLMRDEGSNAVVHAGTAYNSNCKHLFKNTQAIITENLMDDKKRAKTQSLTYGSGNDMNEVRRTVASLLTRTAKDLVRGTVNIYRYPFIELTGRALATTSTLRLKPTQNVLVYGGRPGMLVTKTDADGNFIAGVLAEQITTDDVRGKLNTGSWAQDDYYRMYIHLRAGNSVRVVDPFGGNSVATNAIITKLTFHEGSSIATTALEVIGYQDLPTATPIRPLGTVTKAVVDNKGALAGPITLGKARLSQLTFSSGDPAP